MLYYSLMPDATTGTGGIGDRDMTTLHSIFDPQTNAALDDLWRKWDRMNDLAAWASYEDESKNAIADDAYTAYLDAMELAKATRRAGVQSVPEKRLVMVGVIHGDDERYDYDAEWMEQQEVDVDVDHTAQWMA